MTIYDWERGTDGSIGISGSAIDAEGRGSGFIAWISPDGTKSTVIQTAMYRPLTLALAPDGSLWVAGRADGDKLVLAGRQEVKFYRMVN